MLIRLLGTIVCGLLLVAALVFAGGAGARPGASGGDPANDGYIVVYDEDVADPSAATDRRERSHGFRARLRYASAIKGFAATLNAQQVERLRADPRVASVTEDRVVTAAATVPLAAGEPTPPTGVRRIGAATTSSVRPSSSVNVAVIDTGVDLDHPDLDAVHGRNCVTPAAAAYDEDGHGTHVAGTIAARNDGAGVVGIAPGTRILAVKVLDAAGSGTTSQVICGVDWVTSTLTDGVAGNDVKVANMSLGATGPPVRSCATTSDPMHRAICASTAAGATYVAAAGNSGWDFDHATEPDVPAAYPEVLTVTAIADSDGRPGGLGPSCAVADDTHADFSNFALTSGGAAHTVAGPGGCIRSTWPGGAYRTLSGTSMASPHVAGAIALCHGEAGRRGPCADLSPAGIITRMRGRAEVHSTADPGYGFAGDPLRPSSSRYYGHLVAPPASLPAVSLTQPAHGTSSADATPTFAGGAGQAAGDADVVHVEVFAGATATGAPLRTLSATPAAGAWSVTLPAEQALSPGTYTARARQAGAGGDAATTAPHTFTIQAAPTAPAPQPVTTPAPTPATVPPGDPAALQPPPSIPQSFVPTAVKQPAKLQVQRALVDRGRSTLEVLAPITARATGAVEVTFHAAGIRTRFRHAIRAGSSRLRIVRSIPRRQARLGTGIVTLRYAGNDRTRPQEVRLRAAVRSARLAARRPRLDGGRLRADGTVTTAARGVVRVQLDWSRDGRARGHAMRARIQHGRWQLDAVLPAGVRADIAARDGTLHSYVLFTGYGPRRIRGEMRSLQVLGERAGTPR